MTKAAQPPSGSANGWRRWLPLLAFLALLLLLAAGLQRDPRELPSALLGKPLPAFSLASVEDASRRVDSQSLRGQPWMLNVWASWCSACLQEHPALTAFAATGVVPVIGLNHKDGLPEARRWLQQHGSAWQTSAHDPTGTLGMELGVYGVPETFIIDGQGRVRLRHAGPLTEEVLRKRVLPLLQELQHG